jgi:hypothetical protein
VRKVKKTGTRRKSAVAVVATKARKTITKQAVAKKKTTKKAISRKTIPRKTIAKKTTVAKRKKAAGAARKKTAPRQADEEVFSVRALDPQKKCGPGTSVQEMYRVDEQAGSGRTLHLVFFDRHGWYCEHGRNCPAVGHARKFGDRERRHGPTHNGRMRA